MSEAYFQRNIKAAKTSGSRGIIWLVPMEESGKQFMETACDVKHRQGGNTTRFTACAKSVRHMRAPFSSVERGKGKMALKCLQYTTTNS